MLKEAKAWVKELEDTLTELSQQFGETIEDLDKKFEDYYDNGGEEYDYGCGPGPYQNSIQAFRANYENDQYEEEDDYAED